ncbi:MAG: four helix bundle protein [bacterium]
MFRFETLDIWKLAIEYNKCIYKATKAFPKNEEYALTNQLRRASVSISNNIAEGSSGTDKGFIKYLNISIGSGLETVNLLGIARDQNYISESERVEHYKKVEILIKKIRSFQKSLNKK